MSVALLHDLDYGHVPWYVNHSREQRTMSAVAPIRDVEGGVNLAQHRDLPAFLTRMVSHHPDSYCEGRDAEERWFDDSDDNL